MNNSNTLATIIFLSYWNITHTQTHTLTQLLSHSLTHTHSHSYTLRKKGTKAVTGAVPFQNLHFCTQRLHIGTPVVHIST